MPEIKIGMLLLKLILNVSLLFGVTNFFISGISGNDFGLEIRNLPMELRNVIPKHYNIQFTFTNHAYTFNGKSIIIISVVQKTRQIRLNAQKPYVEISHAFITTKQEQIYVMKGYTYHNDSHLIQLDFAEEIPSGIYTLKMDFTGLMDNEAIFNVFYSSDTWSVFATDLQLTIPRKLFPCFDYPELETTFNISIKHDVKYTILSNTPIQDTHKETNTSMMWTHFLQTPLMSTHHLAIVIINKNLFRNHSFLVNEHLSTMWCRKNLTSMQIDFANIFAKNVLEGLETNSKSFQQLTDATHVVIPGFPYDAIMKLGLNIFREEAILLYGDKVEYSHKTQAMRLIAHVVTQERLRNLVKPIRFSQLWLNDAIAMVLGHDVINKAYSQYRMLDLFVVQIQQESLRLDTHPVCQSLLTVAEKKSDIDAISPFCYYVKAPVLLRMLQHVMDNLKMGEILDGFWKGINNYLQHNYSRSTDVDNFCAAMQAVLDSRIPRWLNFEVKEMMYNWAKQTHSVVKVTNVGPSLIRIQIENYNQPSPDNLWIPITITRQSNINFTLPKTWPTYRDWLMKEPEKIRYIDYPLDDTDWVIVNLQQVGYYRVKYNDQNWRKLAKYLNSENYTKIHVLNRAQIIDDAFYFLMKDEMDLFIFLDLTKYLSRETDYIAWYPVIKIFQYLSSFIPYSESAFIKERFGILLNGLFYNKIKHEASSTKHQSNDTFKYIKDQFTTILSQEVYTTTLRQEALQWSCNFDSTFTKTRANERLENGDAEITSSWSRELIYCKGLMIANYSTWRLVFNKYLNAIDNKLLNYLACPENPAIIINYINLTTNDIEIQNRIMNKGMKEHIHIFHSIVARHTNNTVVLPFMLENIERVKPSHISKLVALTDFINHVYDISHLEKIYEYVKTHMYNKFQWVRNKITIRLNEIKKQKEHFHVFF